MYNELYAAWQREIDDPSLGGLPPDFYFKIAEYLRCIKDEDKALDKKSVKMNLLEHETRNVVQMLNELLLARYRKIIKTVTKSKKTPVEFLTVEESKMCEKFVDFTKSYQKFTVNLMQGQITEASRAANKIEVIAEMAPTKKRLAIRFLKNIPAIMGADMKSYGPFVVEDVASLPTQNAQILVKQGLAVLIGIS